MGTTIIFQCFTIFPPKFYLYFYPQIANLGIMKLDIIAYNFRKIMNSHCAKLYVKTTTYMDTTTIFHFLTIFAHNFTISPQNSKFWKWSAWHHSWYLYLGYELPLCKILYQCINKYEYYQDFPISRDFWTKFYCFTPKYHILDLFCLAS